LVEQARARNEAAGEEESCHHHESSHDHAHHHADTGSTGKWQRIAAAFAMDWSMLWKEILIGFLIAGFLAVLVPDDWWASLFMTHGPWLLRLAENCIVGPLIAILSFVCSVGNIPMASLFWSSGIAFGGVISFIYADLIIIPLIFAYRKYYGGKLAAYITGIFFISMALAGGLVDVLFKTLGLVPSGKRPPNPMAHAGFSWNYTTWLDLIAILFAAILFYMRAKRSPSNQEKESCHHGR
jgi:hypothetical protein